MDIYQFILQLFSVAVVPLFLAMLKQNKKMTDLQQAYENLRKQFDNLQIAHQTLQAKYEANLAAQAGMREKF